jgi:hypothetical protein
MESSERPNAVYTKPDFMAFGITFVAVLAAYCLTLSTDVGLECSGILATAGMHAGVPSPPGYPIWIAVSWVFVHSVPIGNVAWRLSLSSSLAAALACGLIALMGCRSATSILTTKTFGAHLTQHQRTALATISGIVGGMAFAFSKSFWSEAVIVDVVALNMLLFCVVLALLMHWLFRPRQRRYLYAAFFFYGLTIIDAQSLIAASVGLQFFAVFGQRAFGRDLLIANSCLLLLGLGLKRLGWFPNLDSTVLTLYLAVSAVTIIAAAVLVVKTRRIFTHWKPVLVGCAFLIIATLSYFAVPILSMTNPPVNWAYTRTIEGFFHALTRGQFERLHPILNGPSFFDHFCVFVRIAVREFGVYFLFFAAIPIVLYRRLGGNLRRWIAALCVLFITTTFLLGAVLNPGSDRQTVELISVIFAPIFIILALLTSAGLAMVGAILTEPLRESALQEVSN